MIVYVHKLYVCIYCKYNVYNVGLESGIYVYIPLSLLIVTAFQGVHVVHLYNNCQRKGSFTTKCNAYKNGRNACKKTLRLYLLQMYMLQ